ncbi:aminotransferase class IV [uncultured Flavobacterium sp.]|uniref:aminotransferase class IV n=1 Tax=uncultured Flavobacterium sp. TaxID=165435 RepID=UPI0030ED0897|tara:strand:+ start:29899 stop:30729 length:831 start_codon:yes stop_codon:yes gene_type:complete
MINFNGNIQDSSATTIENNRGFLFGDAVFETLKVIDGKVLFAEDHYFRLMASMRICRMEIPMNFTLEYFEDQILSLTNSLKISDSARVRLTVYRSSKGFYLPETNAVDFVAVAQKLNSKEYSVSNDFYEVELYKDFYVSKHLLSTLKTTNKMINVTGSIFAKENDYHNCILLNDDKNVVEALNGNIFMKMENSIITPPISDGCLNGIMRKQLIVLINKMEGFECVEKSISPFDLQKSDELFITNVITGIQPITKYRKKEFGIDFSIQLNEKLNELI